MNLFRRSLLAKQKIASSIQRRKAFLQGGPTRRGLQAERLEARTMMAADIIPYAGSDYWNPRNPEDVNADGYVAPSDALNVINALNSMGATSLSSRPQTVLAAGEAGSSQNNSLFYDVNNDGFLSPIDALAVINRLNNAEGELSTLATQLVTYNVKAIKAGATNFNDPANILSSIDVGQDYDLVVTVRDMRTGATGVYAAFLDVQYQESLTDNEIQELQQVNISDLAADGGTFTLSLGAITTDPITYSSILGTTGLNIQNALNAKLGAGSVSVVASDITPSFLIRFQGAYGDQNVALMTGTNVSLGAGETVQVTNSINVNEANVVNGDFTSGRAFMNSVRFNNFYTTAKAAQDGSLQASPGPFQGIDDAGGAYSRTTGTLGPAERELWRVRMNAKAGGVVNFVGSTADQLRPLHDTLMFAATGETTRDNALPVAQDQIVINSATLTIRQLVDAVNDNYTVPEKSVAIPLSPPPLANDTQTTLPALSIVTTNGTTTAGGTFTRTGSGATATFLYTPPSATFNGNDSFNYTITDGTNTDTATISITVTPVNDAPTLSLPTNQSVNEYATLTFSSANGNAITVADVDAGTQNVTVTIVYNNTEVNYTPPAAVAGVTFSSSIVGNQTTITLTGTTALITQQLNGLQVTPIAKEVNFTSSATITVNDNGNTGTGGAKTATGTLSVSVIATNEAPINSVPGAQNTTDEDPLVFSVANGNGFSFIDDGLSTGTGYSLTFQVSSGILTASAASGVTISGNGTGLVTLTGTKAAVQGFLAGSSLTYNANLNFAGTDTLTLTTNDGGNRGTGGPRTDIDTVSIVVVPKTRPKAIDDAYTFTETNGTVKYVLPVLTGDRPHDGFQATLLSINTAGVTAAQGTLAINDNGTPGVLTDDYVEFTPAADFFTNPGQPVTFTYTINDTVPVGNTNPERGVDSTATVRITLTNTPDAPTSVQDGPYAATEDTLLTVNAANGVLANDSSLDRVAITAELVTGPTHIAPGGSFNLNADGSFSYRGATNYNGADTFTYRARDINGLFSAPITVTINVAPVNDAPVVGALAPYAVDEDNTLTVSTRATGVLATATDVDSNVANLTATLVTPPPASATQSFTFNPDGTFVFVPVLNFSGPVTFTFTVSDDNNPAGVSLLATATINVRPINDAPVAVDDGTALAPAYTAQEDTLLTVPARGVLTNDTDVDTAAASLTAVLVSGPSHAASFSLNADGSFSYQATLDYNGPDSFTYRVFDGALNSVSTATVYLNVIPTNDPPVAVDDFFSLDEDIPTTFNAAGPKGQGVLANDTDVDSATLTAQLVSGPAHAASFTLNADGSFSYTGALNYNGSDSFTYRAFDGINPSGNIATVRLTINAVNDAPPVANDTFTAIKDFVDQTINVLANDGVNNPDGVEVLTITSITQPANGSATVAVDGKSVIYTPTAGYEGPDSLTYTISDGNGGVATATVTIDVVRFRPTDITGTVFIDLDDNGLIGAGETRRLGGVELTLTGTDFQGALVSLMATTDVNGYYRFAGVRPGSYVVTELQPEGTRDGKEVLLAGTLGAAVGTNDTYNISLPILGIDGGVNSLNFAEKGVTTQFMSISDLLSSDGGWGGTGYNYGAIMAMGPGGPLWSSALDGWANLRSMSISSTSDPNVATLHVIDMAGNAYTRNIYQFPPAGTTGRFRILGSTSGETIYRLEGKASDFGLNLMAATSAPEGESQSYASGVDSLMTEQNWA